MKFRRVETDEDIEIIPKSKKIKVYEDEYNAIKAQSAYYYNENKQLKTLLRNILQFAGVCLDELVQGNDEDYTALFEEMRRSQERIKELHRQCDELREHTKRPLEQL